MASFQESAQSWRSKTHIGIVKPPVLIGLCALVIVVLFLVGQSIWQATQTPGFELLHSSTEENGNKGSDAAKDSGVNDDDAPHQTDRKSDDDDEAESAARDRLITVHVGGAVASPGVYEVDVDSRVQSAIDAAGGFIDGAAMDAVNRARLLQDGEQIIIPTQLEVEQAQSQGWISPDSGSTDIDQRLSSDKVNINTATMDQLVTLSGIGESTAQKIIADREAKGLFKTPEDLMRVSGIGEKKFAALADSICV